MYTLHVPVALPDGKFFATGGGVPVSCAPTYCSIDPASVKALSDIVKEALRILVSKKLTLASPK
jgi:hypothetical protein